MQIEFASRQLQRCFEDHAFATRHWGNEVANSFADRVLLIQDTRAWAGLIAIRSLRMHPLSGPRALQWSIRLSGRWRLIVRPVEGDAGTVTIVRIEEVSNHYGD